jgi:hypothetical protein
MERLKNAALVLCLFIVLIVIFSSYFRASEVGTFFGALAGTPLVVHVFNRLAPRRPAPGSPKPSTKRRDMTGGTEQALVFETDDAGE